MAWKQAHHQLHQQLLLLQLNILQYLSYCLLLPNAIMLQSLNLADLHQHQFLLIQLHDLELHTVGNKFFK